MKNLSKRIIAIAIGGCFLISVGSSITEASPFPVENAQQVQFHSGPRPDDNPPPPPPPPPPKKEKRRHHDRDRNRVIVGGAMIGAAMNNDF
ncbi:MAG: hypothetical protein H6Q70_1630 [Firmicutes bacterium]|nr:hypothetical protein [Bacillota bacterium]